MTGRIVCYFVSSESGCDTFWDQNAETRACYQFNLYSIMTWGQAHSSCRAQGGGLLSITDLTEQKYIRGMDPTTSPKLPRVHRRPVLQPVVWFADRLNDVGVVVWIGLNHLDENGGWNWSDGAPLSLVNFTEGNAFCPRTFSLAWGPAVNQTPLGDSRM